MPRTPTDYSQTIQYKIVCKDLEVKEVYNGHTTSFRHRKNEHKSRTIHNFPFPIYQFINSNGGWDNWEMIEIEKYPCKDANEARARERYWYEELKSKLNDRCPTLNVEKKKENSKLYLRQYNQTLTEEQKQAKYEYNTEWKKQTFTCSCGSTICNAVKFKHLKTKKHLTKITAN